MKLLPKITFSVFALSGLLSSTHADDVFNYNYAQFGYSFINDFEVDQGVTISGSYDVTENINVLGSYFISTHANSDQADDVDITNYSLGVGYHTAYSDKTDFIAEAGLFNTDADVEVRGITINTDNSGYLMAAGVRHKLKEKVEVSLRAEHRNSDSVTDNHFTLGSRYYFKPNLSVGADFNTGSDNSSESITGSVRWEF